MRLGISLLVLLIWGSAFAADTKNNQISLTEQAELELSADAALIHTDDESTTTKPTLATVVATERFAPAKLSRLQFGLSQQKYDLSGRGGLAEIAEIELSELPAASLTTAEIRWLKSQPAPSLYLQDWGLSASVSYAGQQIQSATIEQEGVAETRYHLFLYTLGVDLEFARSPDSRWYGLIREKMGFSNFVQVSSDSYGNINHTSYYLHTEVALGVRAFSWLNLEVGYLRRDQLQDATKRGWKVDPSAVTFSVFSNWRL